MIKRILVILLMTFCISGCTKKDTRTVVQFSSWGSQSEIEIIKPILAEFEKENPDIKIDFLHIPQNYFQKIHLLFASNLAPDVIFINNLSLPIYANAGMLEPFIAYSQCHPELVSGSVQQAEAGKIASVSPSSKIQYLLSRNDVDRVFFKKSLQSLSYKNKLYAVPRDVSNLVVYYNKDLFDKYNVPYPNRYWSFEDFLVFAQKLTKDTNKDGKPDVFGVSFEEDSFYYLPYLMSEGGGILSDDLKEQIIDTPQSQKGLRFYSDLRNKYHVAPTEAQTGSATMAQMFLQGKLAMHISGRWLVPKYREDAKFDWNVINFPSGDKGSIVPLDASGWAIAKSSKHKQEAMRLIKYLSSKESIEKFSKSGLIVPARVDVARGEFLSSQKSQKPKSAKVFIDVIKTSKPTPVSTNYSEIQDKLKERTNYLFNN